MIRHRLFCVLVAALAMNSASAETWTYRGSLLDAGQPAQGRYDFRIALYTEPLAGKLAVPAQTLSGLDVKDGHFSAELDLDPKLLGYAELWLAVEVGDGAAGFVPLDARTRIVPKAAQATGCWDLQGNVLTGGEFLGPTSNSVLTLSANGDTGLRIAPTAQIPNLIGGDSSNVVRAGVYAATIGGGGDDSGFDPNQVNDHFGTVAGGKNNTAGNSAVALTATQYASVGGGIGNEAVGPIATVAGGSSNTASGFAAVVAGGTDNCAGGSGSFAGGWRAKVRPGTSFPSTGQGCDAVAVSGDAGGDEGSFVWADYTAVPLTTTGPNQFLVRADGGFILNTTALPSSTDDLVISARATTGDADADLVLRTRAGKLFRTYVRESDGAVVFNPVSASGDTKFVFGGASPIALRYLNTATGAYLSTSGVWTDNSSRALKTDFVAIDANTMLDKVLDLSINEWSYIVNRGTRHVGPVAEDFHASFGLGESAAHIASVDSVGVALAAIQGLNAKLESENARLRSDIDALKAAVAELKALR